MRRLPDDGERARGERDAMDWLMDDDMMKHWEEISKDEEEIKVKRRKGGKLQVEKVQSTPELVLAHTQMRKR